MTKVEKLKVKIAKLDLQICAEQTFCTHPDDQLVKIPKSDSDDYDRGTSQVTYWYDCTCKLCDKFFQKPQ